MKLFLALTLSIITWTAESARAAGFENPILWSGKFSGMGGASAAQVSGAQALFFNPAGIVKNKPGQDASFNLTSSNSSTQAPISTSNETVSSNPTMTSPLGLLYSASPSEDYGYALGAYTAASLNTDFENIDYPDFPGGPDLKTSLQISEIAAGVAYQLNPKLKFGSAIRLVSFKARFKTLKNESSLLLNPDFKKLAGSDIIGFKFGLQYKLNKQVQFGLAYRSQVDLQGRGWISGDTIDSIGDLPITTETVSVKMIFPQQVNMGVLYRWDNKWTSAAEVSWTNYSKMSSIEIAGTINSSHTTAQTSNLKLDWADLWVLRLGGEFNGFKLPIRAGYIYSSQVTNSKWAQATFSPPGASHTLTMGTGLPLAPDLQFEGGAEYTMNNGHVGQGGSADVRPGDYSMSTAALHMGFEYNF